MILRNRLRHLCRVSAIALAFAIAFAWIASTRRIEAADSVPPSQAASFNQVAKPFLTKNCVRCHNVDTPISGVRVDHLDASLEDRHLKMWESVRHKVRTGTMPPKGQPQPSDEERRQMDQWITKALDIARSRPTPKNGQVRRLTVAQYRNTLRDLLLLEDDFTEILPPDAISKDGFVNNKETLQLSPLLMEAYMEIAEEALSRSIVETKAKPWIQNFRMDLGAGINKNPLPEQLILGANSLLLENKDFTVTQLTPRKPFAFEPFFMRTKYRFIEGYQGNDTVRGWREYDSIYHSVFACMRGSGGYPKGKPYSTVPEGLLLRPAIPNDEIFDDDGTYGPKANFKISLRELPDNGRFRVTVTAAKYNDGLLLDPGAETAEAEAAIVARDLKSKPTVTIAKPGVYQVDVHEAPRDEARAKPDVSRLNEGLGGSWTMDDQAPDRLVDSPFGKALSLTKDTDSVVIPRESAINVGTGDFTLAAWIHPTELRRAGIVSAGGHSWTHGWIFEMPSDKGALRLETSGPDTQPNGSISAPAGVIRKGEWQHVAAVVRRGKESFLYVNGFPVAKGKIGAADLDNPKLKLQIGRVGTAQAFKGQLDEVHLYRRALDEAELQALIEPGREFAVPPPEKPQEITLKLGGRDLQGALQQPAFAVVRLEAGPLAIEAENAGVRRLDRIVFTSVSATADVGQRFAKFEKRSPRLGVHLGLRRDCGSTFARVGTVRDVSTTAFQKYIFEGAIRNYPSPDVEKDNVNYLAGVREIAVRSEYTDGRDMPRLVIKSVEFEGPYYDEWPPATHKNIFIDSPQKNDPPAYARQIIRRFATRAYRRPVTPTEESTLIAVFQKTHTATGDFQAAVKDALQVVLTSPQFLFLVEKSQTPQPEPLDNYELSSKLSYFLWNGPPDARTLQLAAAGALRTQLDAEVDRMVADPKFARFAREFGAQWLSLDKFSVLEADRKRFPKLTRDVRTHLWEEPIRFFEYLVRNNLPVKNLITSDVVVANEAVASYYGLGDKTEKGFQFIPIAHGRRELGGVLTQAAMMAGLSDGRESNPVKRGAWLARKIVAEPPDDPPPNVPALKESSEGLTLRRRIEQHRSQHGCVQCHTKIDPWGIALEEFDADGRIKTKPADARSVLPDNVEVNGIGDLKRHLSEDRIDQVAFSVLKHLATYATGRTLTYNEVNFLKKDGLRLKAGGYRMRDMIRYVVTSKLFLEK
ncbi:MAG: DUF1592 domain-containing protein [Bryobacterales bacterium]|nr:DUF1592 domain-containing protein [Bryobacterales bacterium]